MTKKLHKITIALNDEELKAIDNEANHYQVSRAKVLRACLYNHAIGLDSGGYTVPSMIGNEDFPKKFRCLYYPKWINKENVH